MRSLWLMVLLAASGACTPTQRVVVGSSIAVAGLGTSVLALDLATTCTEDPLRRGRVCRLDDDRRTREVVAPVAFAGLGAVVVGGMIATMGASRRSSPASPTTASSAPLVSSPEPLDVDTASGIALAQLVTSGYSGDARPLKLEAVEQPGHLLVDDRRAELRELRVRTAPNGTVLTLTACFAYTTEWIMQRVGVVDCEP